MASYGSNSDAQVKAFGAANSSLDTKTSSFRDTATAIINAFLNLENDIASPSAKITQCANLITAAFLRAKPGEEQQDSYYKQAMELLEKLRGDNAGDAPWRINIPVERFRGITVIDEIRPHNFVT